MDSIHESRDITKAHQGFVRLSIAEGLPVVTRYGEVAGVPHSASISLREGSHGNH